MNPQEQELENRVKQEYIAPKLTRHGDVETLTSGSATHTVQTDIDSRPVPP